MKLYLVYLFTVSTVLFNSCATVSPTQQIANNYCDCVEAAEETNGFVNRCDSVAESNLELLMKKKWEEVNLKKLPIDSMRTFKLSLHMEYWKMTEKCRKSPPSAK